MACGSVSPRASATDGDKKSAAFDCVRWESSLSFSFFSLSLSLVEGEDTKTRRYRWIYGTLSSFEFIPDWRLFERERERVNTDVFNTDLRFINASFFVRLETENRLYLGSAVMMAV